MNRSASCLRSELSQFPSCANGATAGRTRSDFHDVVDAGRRLRARTASQTYPMQLNTRSAMWYFPPRQGVRRYRSLMSKVALPTHETRAAGRVPLPRMVADKLFWFDRLSSSFEIRGILTIGWRFVDWMTDPWSSRFNRFKFGDARDARAGNTLALQALRLIDWSKLGTVGVTAALSSSAEVLDPNSRLSHLGQHCAADLHLRWHGDILRKKAHRALHTISGSAARATEVDGKYTCTKVPDCQLLLVCDDFATNGRTVSDIQALKRWVPDRASRMLAPRSM